MCANKFIMNQFCSFSGAEYVSSFEGNVLKRVEFIPSVVAI